jgi:transcriptional regulator MraZ
MGGTSAVPIGRPLPSVQGRALGEEVALFLSTFVNKVDRKGRVSVPATFRAAVAGQSFAGIVAFPSFEHEALEATGIDRMEAISAGLDELEQPEEQQSLATLILARSQQLPFDTEGRIVLTDNLVSHAHIADSAAFVGLGPTFQIWEPDRFAEHEATLLDRTRRQGTRMPPLGSLLARRRQ